MVSFGIKEQELLPLSVSTFTLIFMSALSRLHWFTAWSISYARGITRDTPLKKAKPVLGVLTSDPDLYF